MSDVVRLAFPGSIDGRLDVSFEVIAKLATGLALTVDGVARPAQRSGLRRLAGSADAPVPSAVTRGGGGVRITLRVDASWGTPLGELADRLRRTVSDGVNASLGTTLDPEAVWVRFDALRVEDTDGALL